jgi:hypothetical protein
VDVIGEFLDQPQSSAALGGGGRVLSGGGRMAGGSLRGMLR